MKKIHCALTALGCTLALAVLTAPAAEAATVITTADGVIRNSLCVGFDCPGSPSFSDTTILLVENNTRIKFDDTSTASSFPRNDWELQANSSTNGGGNFFAINDCGESSGGGCADDPVFKVEAGAPANSIFVDDGGRVGFSTGAPVVELHVVDGDTPTLRLEQDGSSGFTPQTWDVAGNETNFFVRDVTMGSLLPLRIRPGAPTNSLHVNASGNVGFGTASPANSIHMVKAGTAAILMDDTTAPADESIAQMFVANTGDFHIRGLNDALTQTAAGVHIDISDGNIGIGCTNSASDLTVGNGNNSCTAAGNSTLTAGNTAFTVTSSRSLKKNLQPVEVEGLLERMAGIGVYTYDFIDGPAEKMGLMAEDFHQIFGRGSDKTITGDDVQMALWLAVQELAERSRENDTLRARVARLEALIDQGAE